MKLLLCWNMGCWLIYIFVPGSWLHHNKLSLIGLIGLSPKTVYWKICLLNWPTLLCLNSLTLANFTLDKLTGYPALEARNLSSPEMMPMTWKNPKESLVFGPHWKVKEARVNHGQGCGCGSGGCPSSRYTSSAKSEFKQVALPFLQTISHCGLSEIVLSIVREGFSHWSFLEIPSYTGSLLTSGPAK